MKQLATILLLAFTLGANAQAPRLAVRMDDMGAFHSVNKAVIDAAADSVAMSVEIMPVGAWYPEAVKLLRQHPGLDVGLHLAITSEWENVKWRPLSQCPTLTDSLGYFYPMIWSNPNYPGMSILENEVDLADIEREFRAQIERAKADCPGLSHLSGHMLCTMYDPKVAELVDRLSAEYGLPCIDHYGMANKGVEFASYTGADGAAGPHATFAEKEESFIRMLDTLKPGHSYLFIDHPAYNDTEMETVYHIGYEDVGVDRQGVTDLYKSPRVRQAIKERGIELVSISKLLQ